MTSLKLILAGAALALAACGSTGATTDRGEIEAEVETAPPTDHAVVDVQRRAFAPAEVTVTTGGTVEWVWDDSRTDHDVVGDGFRSPVIDTGTFEHTFTEVGRYDYVCTLHRGMDGTVVVVDA